MTNARFLCALAATLVGCVKAPPIVIEADEVNEKADGMPSHLELEDDHRVDFDEPSDLVYIHHKLYAVSDSHSNIYELDTDGDIQDVINVEGTDLEAIGIDEDEHFYIADESKAKVWHVDHHGNREDSYDIDTTDGNSGIEGLTFDDKNHMLVAKEKNPATIIEVNLDDKELNRVKIDYADDISALTWNPNDNHLYALGDEQQRLWRLDGDYNKITSWKLPVENPEGIAFSDHHMYIVSDAEERLYVFNLK